jgi:hypothetical protein
MNCADFQLLLEDHLDGILDAEIEAELLAHAGACRSCAARREFDLRLLAALRSLPVPPPSAGFAERVLGKSRQTWPAAAATGSDKHSFVRQVAAGALAASVAVALGIWAIREPAPEQAAEPPVAVVQPASAGGAQPVRLVFRSASALSNVTIELGLPEGVELAGYPGQRQLVWQSDLRAGANLLELPVVLHGPGGVVTATLNLGAERRQFSVRVVSADSERSGAVPTRVPQRGALPPPATGLAVS